jgi:hypothetical protein
MREHPDFRTDEASYCAWMADDGENAGTGEMRPSYAVVWQRNGEDAVSGGLRCDRHGLHFSGRQSLHVPLAHIRQLSIRRGPAERLRGLPVIALLLAEGKTLRVASLEGIGALHELASALQRATIPLS